MPNAVVAAAFKLQGEAAALSGGEEPESEIFQGELVLPLRG